MTVDRLELAAEVEAAIDNEAWTVHASPPAGITVPCAVVTPAGAGSSPVAFGVWEVEYDVLLYAEGTDLEQLEEATCALFAGFPDGVGQPPSAAQYGASTYLGSGVRVLRWVSIPLAAPLPPPVPGPALVDNYGADLLTDLGAPILTRVRPN
jgi:hypothetical protein